jgi:hypothetical protein
MDPNETNLEGSMFRWLTLEAQGRRWNGSVAAA